jgi:hypothetical protein
MTTLDHATHFPSRAARRRASRTLLVAAGLFGLVFATVILVPPPAPDRVGQEAGSPAVRIVEDWRGNSARITVLPAE